uniref:Uncharacterized protein n=1 Tax=Ascaris lumbricoides TaxID=6252 RepID=A0A0M3IXJ5_ASCLU
MSSSCPSQNAAATTNGQRAAAVGVLPVNVQNAQNSPELANMTVGQLLGQAQRRVSVTHVNSAAVKFLYHFLFRIIVFMNEDFA